MNAKLFGKKVGESIAIAKLNGLSIDQMSLGRKIWMDSKPETVAVNMSKLVNGKTKTIKPEWVTTICNECKVSADFLFSINFKN